LVGFLPPDDPRVKGTVAEVERRLLVDGLALRYLSDESLDGLPPGEGAFLACTFWLADNLALQGRLDEARQLFERLLTLRHALARRAGSDPGRSRVRWPRHGAARAARSRRARHVGVRGHE